MRQSIKMALWMPLLLSALGCQPDTVNHPTESSSDKLQPPVDIGTQIANVAKITKVEDVRFDAVPYAYELPKTLREQCQMPNEQPTTTALIGCPVISVKLAKIIPAWVEQAVNHAITEDNAPKYAEFKKQLDMFAQSQLEEAGGEVLPTSMAYGYTVYPEMLPAHRNVAQFSIYRELYMGGAHAMPSLQYLLFDMSTQQPLTLEGVLQTNKTAEIEALMYEAYEAYAKKQLANSTMTLAEYQEAWAFEVTWDFYFDRYGMVFVYQPAVLAERNKGFVELAIAYEKLTTVLKPEYLPQSSIQ